MLKRIKLSVQAICLNAKKSLRLNKIAFGGEFYLSKSVFSITLLTFKAKDRKTCKSYLDSCGKLKNVMNIAFKSFKLKSNLFKCDHC